ncbi:MAG: hypothetical protein KC649_05935, partial [Candidatus Omnitrophica bacterium]|nr:hypothetical protein [Candidatus Omnitrophota bacterium]
EVICRRLNEPEGCRIRRSAEALGMYVLPCELFSVRSDVMGNAILSRYPIEDYYHQKLQKEFSQKYCEPRGAQWAFVRRNGIRLGIINIHLSCWFHERQRQFRFFLENAPYRLDSGNWIFCGDFNTLPNSAIYKQITGKYEFLDSGKKSHPRIKSWPSVWPFIQIDHIFYKGNLKLKRIRCPKKSLNSRASDHLPVLAEFLHETGS